MQALGQSDAARAFMWTCFARSLNADHLRTWPAGLPDFEDVAAEDQAFEHAQGFESFTRALHFFMIWPAIAQAAVLIDFALKNGRVKRYPHAARHLRECKNLAARIDAFAPFEAHEAYVADLRSVHGKKTSFWGPGM